MMRAGIVIALLPFCSGQRSDDGDVSFRIGQGTKQQKIQALQKEIREAYAVAAPVSSEVGVSFLGQFFMFFLVCVGAVGALALIENRRQSSTNVWLSNQTTCKLLKGLACISVCQFGFGVLRIFDSSAFLTGMLDLASASLGFYLTQVSSVQSTLPTYLLLTAFTSMVDILMLLWDVGQWNGSCGDVARPCLCFAGIYLAYTFLNEVRQRSGKGTGLADRLLDTVLASSLVRQAEFVFGKIEIDPLLLSPAKAMSQVALDVQVCKGQADVLMCPVTSADPREEMHQTHETHRNAGLLGGGLDAEVNDMLSRYGDMLDGEGQQFEEPMYQDLASSPAPQSVDLLGPSLAPPVDEMVEFASDEFDDSLL